MDEHRLLRIQINEDEENIYTVMNFLWYGNYIYNSYVITNTKN